MTLTEQQRAEGWREHDGGACPVPLDSVVSIMIGSGRISRGWTASRVVWPYDAWIAEIGEIIPTDARVIAFRPEARA